MHIVNSYLKHFLHPSPEKGCHKIFFISMIRENPIASQLGLLLAQQHVLNKRHVQEASLFSPTAAMQVQILLCFPYYPQNGMAAQSEWRKLTEDNWESNEVGNFVFYVVELAHGGRRHSSSVDRYSSYSGSTGSRGVSRRTDYRVLVTGLPSSASWQDLKDHMRRAGDVCFSQVFRDRVGMTGIVDYTSYDDMKYAIKKLDGSEFQNAFSRAYVRVKEYDSRRSYSRSPSRSPYYSRSRSHSPYYSRSRSRSRSYSGRGRGRSRSISPRAKYSRRSPSVSPARSSSVSLRSRSRSPPRSFSRSLSRSRSPVSSPRHRRVSRSPRDGSPSRSRSQSPSVSRSRSRSHSPSVRSD